MQADPNLSTSPTLASLLEGSKVSWDVLHARYGAQLQLVDTILGVVPNCDPYLEIWPPAFRTYNLLVPNFLNLPVPVLGLGGPPPHVVGLAMYVASRTAECPYCSAHSCSFAMRRGADPAKVAAALVPDRDSFTEGELAAIAVARSLARIPSELTSDERDALERAYGTKNAEWIVLGAVMMGFLNKFMDTIGVELEQEVVSEVADTLGGDWSPGRAGRLLDPSAPTAPAPPADGWRTKLRLLPLLPAAIRDDRRWQQGVPKRWPAIAEVLRDRTGHDFPTIGRLRSARVRRTIATMLLANLDAGTSQLGIPHKVAAGLVFAEAVGDAELAADVRALAERNGTVPDDDAVTGAVLLLARGASSSPARIDHAILEACRASLSPAAIVELVTWLAVLQMLHRLSAYVTKGHDR